MATIITKNSSTASSVPAAGSLQQGELAVNVTDKKLYTKDSSAAVVKLVGSLGNQEANAVAITGGTINGTAIGGTTPAAAAFTTASASGGFTGNLTGNASTVTNGVYTTGSYADPAWITSLAGSKITGNISGNAANVTGTVAIANGGTGLTALGTGVQTALGQTVTGSGGIVLAASPSLTTPNLGTPSAVTLTNATGLPVSTGISGLGTNVATALGVSVGSVGSVVVNGGALGTPSSGTLTNATGLPLSTGVTGTLAVANGGTGITAFGSGVATALGVNVGSAGAFVVNGGALGTPSSGTVTNLTGTASININGTVGATTPNTGSFTTVTNSGGVRFTDGSVERARLQLSGTSLQLMAGSASVAGISIDSSNIATFTNNPILSGGTANGVAYLNGSKVLTTGSALTFNGTNAFVFGDGSSSTFTAARSSNGNTFTIRSGTGTDSALVLSGDATTASNFVALRAWNSSSYNEVGVYGNGSSGYAYFNLSGSEQMRLTSTGLGIGTSSPAAKLDVTGVFNGTQAVFGNTPGRGLLIGTAINGGVNEGSTVLNARGSGNGQFLFQTDGTTRLTISDTGNLGIGASAPVYRIDALIGAGSGSIVRFGQSGVSNGYTITSNGSALTHTWANTASEAMRLDSSGNLGIGATNPSQKLDVRGSVYVQRDSNPTNALAVQLTNQTTVSNNGCRLSFDAFNIGSSALGVPSDSASLAFYTGGVTSERARITSGGQLLVGTTSATGGDTVSIQGRDVAGSKYCLFAQADTTGSAFALRTYSTTAAAVVGSITFTGSATAYNTSSDYRLKNNPQPLTGSGAFIDALKPKTWSWAADGSKGVGFIAHEVQEVSPGSVVGTKDAIDEDGNPVMQAMEYGSAEFIANIIAELQSLRARVTALEAK